MCKKAGETVDNLLYIVICNAYMVSSVVFVCGAVGYA